MNIIGGTEYFEELEKIHYEITDIKGRYLRMRTLLEKVCKDQSEGTGLVFTNLFSRLNYVCKIKELSKGETYQLNTLRIHANKVINSELELTEEIYLQDLRVFSQVISQFYGIKIPDRLKSILPTVEKYSPAVIIGVFTRINVRVLSWDQDYIHAIDSENERNDAIRIKINIPGINDVFDECVKMLWEGCHINLVDVTIDENGIYKPEFLVIEPDYLLEVSTIAENFKDYGSHPLNYFMSKFNPIPNSSAIIVGNFANNVLDEFLYDDAFEIINLKDVFEKTFKQYPFEFTTCKELKAKDKEIQFIQEINKQYINIRDVVQNELAKQNIDRNKSILEPSFICEILGVHGRMDFLEEGYNNLIELKSGKANDFIGPITPKENHQIQLLIYSAILKYNLGKENIDVKSYLLYSKYPILYYIQHLWVLLKKVINIRNLIVANEYRISNNEEYGKDEVINKITPESLNVKNLTGKLWNEYIRSQILQFKSVFDTSTELELTYFYSLYTFVTKEHYLSKLQISRIDDEREGSYWTDFRSKKEGGELLYDLHIKNGGNKANDEKHPSIIFLIPETEDEIIPNFRKGDIVILYQRNHETDNVTNKQIFKGSIESIKTGEVMVRLRSRQRNSNVLPSDSKYAIEHDYMDSLFTSTYRGLYSFLGANPDRKNLILGQNGRLPQIDESIKLDNDHGTDELNHLVLKSKQAKDLFLLIGPPGTGKTSRALKAMLTEYYNDGESNILLLAYTNRAVDEICEAIEKIEDSPSYIRIGSELSCEEKYKPKLLQEKISQCKLRHEVESIVQKHRIFVGTVASVSSKSAIFQIKSFKVAIIDESSQILEPNLIGILCAKNQNDESAIGKFILIGDHKQLPAVVIQSQENSIVTQMDLQKIGMTDRRNSMFERLYGLHKENTKLCHTLTKQGRMHKDIVLFPSYSFYNNKLELVPTAHQEKQLDFSNIESGNPVHKLIASKRLVFIPSEENNDDYDIKTNIWEARIVAKLVENIKKVCLLNGIKLTVQESSESTEMSIGIITPYRKQIALIRKVIHELNDPELDAITVDTVERYQGSQRDIIIYSFCVNNYRQIKNLTNYIEDDGQMIDRKLNVALTRAKNQLFIVGNPDHLSSNLIYYKLIEFIRSKGGYIDTSVKNFLKHDFEVTATNLDGSLSVNKYAPDPHFKEVFENLVITSLKEDPRTKSSSEEWYKNILGNTNDYNRMNLIGYGRADFSGNQTSLFEYTLEEKVNLYCYYNMRKHYFSTIAIFKTFSDYFEQCFAQNKGRILFIDFGCGPMTSGLAFNQYFNINNNFSFDYLGIDISQAMLNKAKEFALSGLFSQNTKFVFHQSTEKLSIDFWDNQFIVSKVVILNFSYLFGNLSNDDASKMAALINNLMDKYPTNRFIMIYQNSALEVRNKTYNTFKKLVPGLTSISKPRTEIVTYSNSNMSNYDTTENVYYEILSN